MRARRPWSSKHLREAHQLGAEKFAWSKRNPKIGSMTNGNEILGWGMATCTWSATRHNAEVRVSLLADGTARVDCIFLDYPDTKLNEYGARDIGEIGLTGCASAIASAVYHATSVRVRELPIRIEKLLTPNR